MRVDTFLLARFVDEDNERYTGAETVVEDDEKTSVTNRQRMSASGQRYRLLTQQLRRHLRSGFFLLLSVIT